MTRFAEDLDQPSPQPFWWGGSASFDCGDTKAGSLTTWTDLLSQFPSLRMCSDVYCHSSLFRLHDYYSNHGTCERRLRNGHEGMQCRPFSILRFFPTHLFKMLCFSSSKHFTHPKVLEMFPFDIEVTVTRCVTRCASRRYKQCDLGRTRAAYLLVLCKLPSLQNAVDFSRSSLAPVWLQKDVSGDRRGKRRPRDLRVPRLRSYAVFQFFNPHVV